jgi:hypothetical protein
LIIVVVGALIFYLIDRFVRDGRLANLLKILVVLICLAAILQRLLPALGVSWFQSSPAHKNSAPGSITNASSRSVVFAPPVREINPRSRLSHSVVSLIDVILGVVGCHWQPTVSLAFPSLSCMAAASSCSSAARLYRGHCRSRRARLLCCSGVSKYLLISIPQSFCS